MDLAPEGKVIAQNAPGNTVEPLVSTVNLTVSKGQVSVPQLSGRSEKEAADAIRSAGLTVGKISTTNSCVSPGTVALQNPSANVVVLPRSTVTFSVNTCTSTTKGGDDRPPIHEQ